MARYRKVSVEIWNDEKVARLSPWARLMFLFILTHPNMLGMGCMRATAGGLVEELSISLPEGLREGFHEAFRDGLGECLGEGIVKIDQKSSFLCLPNFLRHNQPENPNVVTSWAKLLDLIPQCEAQREYFQRVKWFLEGLSEGYAKALVKAFPKAFPKGLPEALPESVNSEQGAVSREQVAVNTPQPPKVETAKAEESNPQYEEPEEPPPPPTSRRAMSNRQGLPLPPAILNTPAFVETWSSWMRYKSQKNKPVTPETAAALFERFLQLGEVRAIASMKYSIAQSYEGPIEPNANGHTGESKHERERREKKEREYPEPPKRFKVLNRKENP